MKKIIHIALLVAGTSIGVGIVALSMVADINIGLYGIRRGNKCIHKQDTLSPCLTS